MLLNEIVIDENNMGFIPSLGISYQLNPMAKEIINLIRDGKSKEEIIETIASKYDAKWEEVYIDIEDFFQKLKVNGLI